MVFDILFYLVEVWLRKPLAGTYCLALWMFGQQGLILDILDFLIWGTYLGLLEKLSKKKAALIEILQLISLEFCVVFIFKAGGYIVR